MRLTPYLLALAALSACGPDFEPTAQNESPIINGSVSTAADFPSAGVFLEVIQNQVGFAVCTGTLIAPDVVLTAGHCTVDFIGVPGDYFFTFTLDVSQFGMPNIQLPPSTTAVTRLVGHPQFDINNTPAPGLGQWFDVGLAFLDSPVVGVTPEVVADSQDAQWLVMNAAVDIAGYGQTDPNNQAYGVKNHAPSIINEVGDWEMQIGSLPPVAQKCHGDSGGPTYIQINDGRLPVQRLIGITSRAYNEQVDCNAGGIDSRADAYRPWIEQTMIDACNDGTRAAAQCTGGGGLPVPTAGGQPDASVPDTFVADTFVADTFVADTAVADSNGGMMDAAGGEDASMGADGGINDGASGADTSGQTGFRGGGATRDDGCGCTETSHARGSAWVLALVSLVFVMRRRR